MFGERDATRGGALATDSQRVSLILLCRSSKLHLSPKADVKSLMSYVANKTKVISGKYHSFLERYFPRFYVLYTTFTKGKKNKTKLQWESLRVSSRAGSEGWRK